MTQQDIYVMDLIVSKMAEGATLSKALKLVYSKRNISIPYSDGDLNVPIMELKMSARATNAMLRAKMRTIGDIVEFCKGNKITDITNLGVHSGIEIFETILDHCWGRMDNDERTAFLIDTVERNSQYIRPEIA